MQTTDSFGEKLIKISQFTSNALVYNTKYATTHKNLSIKQVVFYDERRLKTKD